MSGYKSKEEIHKAHDILVAIILGEVADPFSQNELAQIQMAAAATLCWVLGHDHSDAFDNMLASISLFFESAGIEVKRVQ